MSLKAELETWAAALKAYDEQDFEKSLDMFSVSGPRSTHHGEPAVLISYSPQAHRRFIQDSHQYGAYLRDPWRT